MESARPILSEFTCENGLHGFIRDQSRPIPGDRWQIEVRLEVSVPVREEYFSGCSIPQEAYRDFVAKFGHAVRFEQARVRNFISSAMKEELIQIMTHELAESVVAYVGRPDFPRKFIMTKYRDWKEKEQWISAHERLVRQTGEMERER